MIKNCVVDFSNALTTISLYVNHTFQLNPRQDIGALPRTHELTRLRNAAVVIVHDSMSSCSSIVYPNIIIQYNAGGTVAVKKTPQFTTKEKLAVY